MGKIAIMPTRFWEWFDERRQEYDLSDSGVARKAAIAQSVISKARNGLQPMGYEALAKIADALETPAPTVFALAGYIEANQALTPEQAALLQMYDEMTDDDQEEVLAIVKVRAKRGRREQPRQKA